MLQWSLYFSSQEGVTEKTKIAQFINLLTDKSLTWVTAVWSQGEEHTTSFEHFLEHFQQVFDYSPKMKEVSEQLLMFKQSNQSAAEFALKVLHTNLGQWLE